MEVLAKVQPIPSLKFDIYTQTRAWVWPLLPFHHLTWETKDPMSRKLIQANISFAGSLITCKFIIIIIIFVNLQTKKAIPS